MIIGSPTGQSPAAWALVNYIKSVILGKLNDVGFRYSLTAAETAGGFTTGTVAFGFDPGDLRRYKLALDGVTDDTVLFQKAVDANKGGRVTLPEGYTMLAAGVMLVGAAYNNTSIDIRGEWLMKASPLAGTLNYHSGGGAGLGAYVAIAFENCDGCRFNGYINGNRANQPQDEHIYCVALSGVNNFSSDWMNFREIRGDGLYIDQVSWTVNASPDSFSCSFGVIKGFNSADDGRNLVSIISLQNASFGEIHSYQIGGTVNAVVEPGGVDIEPDASFQNVVDISFGTINVVTGGNQEFGIHGIAVTNDATRDWNVNRITVAALKVRNTNASGVGIDVARVRFLNINGQSVLLQTAGGVAAAIDYADHVTGKLNLAGGLNCCEIGLNDYVQNFDLEILVGSYGTYGLTVAGVNTGKFRGCIYGAAGTVGTYHIQLTNNARAGLTPAHVTYSINVAYDGKNAGAVTAAGITVGTGISFRDCDMSGYASFANQITGLSIRSHNVVGRNIQNGQNVVPAAGQWANGDLFWFDTANSGVPPGAYCTASGAPGTWKQFAAMAA